MVDLGAVMAELKEERAKLDRAIAALSGVSGGKSSTSRRPKKVMSAAARKKIAAAQRARWAKVKARKKGA
jgi:hypothetical protein